MFAFFCVCVVLCRKRACGGLIPALAILSVNSAVCRLILKKGMVRSSNPSKEEE
jgi:hypothetical protein